jgi:hypothetical protein
MPIRLTQTFVVSHKCRRRSGWLVKNADLTALGGAKKKCPNYKAQKVIRPQTPPDYSWSSRFGISASRE